MELGRVEQQSCFFMELLITRKHHTHLALLLDLAHLEHPGVRPDLHEVLVVDEHAGASVGRKLATEGTGEVLLVQSALLLPQADGDDVLVLGQQVLGERGVIPALHAA